MSKIVATKETLNEIVLESNAYDSAVAMAQAYGIDLEEWQIVEQKRKVWHTPMRERYKDIVYEEGMIESGTIFEGEITTHANTIIEATFLRNELQPVNPTLQPIEMPEIEFEDKKNFKNGKDIKMALVWADPQIGFRKDTESGLLDPFHDRVAIDLIMAVAKELDVDRIDILGDFLDLSEFSSRFLTEVEFLQTAQPAFTEAAWLLYKMRELMPYAEINLYEGNHEKRLATMIQENAPFVYDIKSAMDLEYPVMSLPHLLDLKGVDVGWIGDYPSGRSYLTKDFYLCHGDEAVSGSGKTIARILGRDVLETFMQGHGHRVEGATKTVWWKGKSYYVNVHMVGCACRLDGVVPGDNGGNNWQQGFAIVEYNEERFNIHHYLIEDNSAIVDGKIFEGKDYKKELKAAFPKYNW